MSKKILKRILALTIVFLMIISTPFYISENINNNLYVYATTTFIQDLESKLFIQTLIPTLISAGLVFKSKESIEKVAEDAIEWLKEQGFDWKPPNEPDGPNLEDVVKEMLKAITLVSASYELGKGIVKIPQMLWDLIKSFVDENYDEGENIESSNLNIKVLGTKNSGIFSLISKTPNIYYYTIKLDNSLEYVKTLTYNVSTNNYTTRGDNVYTNPFSVHTVEIKYGTYSRVEYISDNKLFDAYLTTNTKGGVFSTETLETGNPNVALTEENISNINGAFGIVDNPNYDWNNKYTDTKVIPIPIEMDAYGNLKKDENGYYLPSTDVDEWLDVQPTEIPNLNPTGTPIPDIPPFPDIENPDDDEQTGIMIYIGNILQIIVGQLSKIVEGVKTIVSNTNQLVFNTPNPVFDPITGEQIDPETGQPVVPEPVVETCDGIIGDGIDTNIPTDFEWGDFRHLLDIFFIFIYFIVILILILLKFLQVVFTGLPAIAANTDLFIQYPNILEGVNYVKNLQVGGMSITVQQAFEYIFMIFFYIFVIKQIRKLYNAHVFEQSAENKRNTEDMKLDYYDKKKDNYENIKLKGWSDNK